MRPWFLVLTLSITFLLGGVISMPQTSGAAPTSGYGALYAVDGINNTTGNLYVLDPSNASVLNTVGPLDSPIRSIDIDPTTGILYGLRSHLNAAALSKAQLVTIDKNTAATTFLTDITVLYPDGTPMNLNVNGGQEYFGMGGMTFTPDGRLYSFVRTGDQNYGQVCRMDIGAGTCQLLSDTWYAECAFGMGMAVSLTEQFLLAPTGDTFDDLNPIEVDTTCGLLIGLSEANSNPDVVATFPTQADYDAEGRGGVNGRFLAIQGMDYNCDGSTLYASIFDDQHVYIDVNDYDAGSILSTIDPTTGYVDDIGIIPSEVFSIGPPTNRDNITAITGIAFDCYVPLTLTLSKSFNPTSVPVTNNSVANFAIDNSASSAAITNVDIRDEFPAGLLVGSLSSVNPNVVGIYSSNNCSVSANPDMVLNDSIVDFTVASVPAGEICNVYVNVWSQQTGEYCNPDELVTVFTSDQTGNLEPDFTTPCVTFTEETVNFTLFDPAISKIGQLAVGQVGVTGEQIEWVVTLSNTSGVTGNNVIVTDVIDSRMIVENVVATGGDVSINGQAVTITYANLFPGQSVRFSIFITVLDGLFVTNTACVTAANQGAEECATANVLGTDLPDALPQTGKSPWSALRLPLMIFCGLLSLAAIRRKLVA